ncbi:hypothetical protein, partial [Salmonella enterica subsp. enterica serovar Rissen]
VTKWPAFYAGCGRINADGNHCRQLHPPEVSTVQQVQAGI